MSSSINFGITIEQGSANIKYSNVSRTHSYIILQFIKLDAEIPLINTISLSYT